LPCLLQGCSDWQVHVSEEPVDAAAERMVSARASVTAAPYHGSVFVTCAEQGELLCVAGLLVLDTLHPTLDLASGGCSAQRAC
jgi:hypothetical protein